MRAVAAGFEGQCNPRDLFTGPGRLIAPAMQQAIAGASLARRTVNLRLPIVKARFWLPGRFGVAASGAVSKNAVLYRGTEGSNPSPSSGESANPRSRST